MLSQRSKLVPAVHVFVMRDAQVLLSRRVNTGYEDGNYSVIAGHLDSGEDVNAAAIREAQEEAGIHVASADIEVVGVMHRKADDGRIDFFVVAHAWFGEIVNREPHKCDDLSWFTLDQLPENVIPYVRRALENYRTGVWFDSFGWDISTGGD